MSMTRNDSLKQMAVGLRKYAGFTAAQILLEPVARGLAPEDRAFFEFYGPADYQVVAKACQGRSRGVTLPSDVQDALESSARFNDPDWMPPARSWLRFSDRKKLPAAVALGRRGGQAKTEAKAAAARENGKLGGAKGGRPRKGTHCSRCGVEWETHRPCR